MSTLRRWTGGPAPLWSCTPPPPRVRKYEVLKVLPGKATELVIVSSALVETRTHQVDRRTQPCTGEQGQCWVDHSHVGSPRYGAWLAVKYPNLIRVWLVRLTAIAVGTEPRLRDKALDLAGLTLRVWRLGNTEWTEMNAKLLTELPRATVLPECPDVRFCLTRMWSADDRSTPIGRAEQGLFQRAHAAQAKGGVA